MTGWDFSTALLGWADTRLGTNGEAGPEAWILGGRLHKMVRQPCPILLVYVGLPLGLRPRCPDGPISCMFPHIPLYLWLQATSAGALYVNASASTAAVAVFVDGSSFTGNTGRGDTGGAVVTVDAPASFIDTTFDGNTAKVGIWLGATTTFDGFIGRNSAGKSDITG